MAIELNVTLCLDVNGRCDDPRAPRRRGRRRYRLRGLVLGGLLVPWGAVSFPRFAWECMPGRFASAF